MLFKPVLALAVLVNVVGCRSFNLEELLKRELFQEIEERRDHMSKRAPNTPYVVKSSDTKEHLKNGYDSVEEIEERGAHVPKGPP
ncbi:hypothetical protein LSAT2_006786, partial [Lamellibrachia satsuma]